MAGRRGAVLRAKLFLICEANSRRVFAFPTPISAATKTPPSRVYDVIEAYYLANALVWHGSLRAAKLHQNGNAFCGAIKKACMPRNVVGVGE